MTRPAVDVGVLGMGNAKAITRSVSQVSDLGISISSILPGHLPQDGPLDCSTQYGQRCSHLPLQDAFPILLTSLHPPSLSFRPGTEESPSLCLPFLLLQPQIHHVWPIFLPKNS